MDSISPDLVALFVLPCCTEPGSPLRPSTLTWNTYSLHIIQQYSNRNVISKYTIIHSLLKFYCTHVRYISSVCVCLAIIYTILFSNFDVEQSESSLRKKLCLITYNIQDRITVYMNLIFVVPCIMLNSEIIPTRCNNCVYSSQWLYSTCFG